MKKKPPLLNPKYSAHKIRKLLNDDISNNMFELKHVFPGNFPLVKNKPPHLNPKYSAHKIRKLLNVDISNYLFELKSCFPRLCSNQQKTSTFETKILCAQNQKIMKC